MVKAKHTVVNFLKTLNYGTYLIDFFVLLFLVVFIQLEENILSGIKTIVPEAFYRELFNEGSNIQLAGLMVALPSVLSIVVLVISIGKSNVLGTKIYKINSLRGPCCYSLLHFSILSVLMLAALTILSVFKLQMSLLYLDLAAAFISIYFLVQEIPLLSNSELATRFIVRGIFRRAIKKIDYSDIDNGASLAIENNETFLQISAYLAFDLGIYKAVSFVLKRNRPNDQWIATRILIKAEETVLRSLTKGKRGTIFSETDSTGGIGYPVGKAFDGAAENLSAIIKTIGGYEGDNLVTQGISSLSINDTKTIYGEDAKKLTKLLEKVEILYFKDDTAAKSKLQDAILAFNELLSDTKFFYLPYQLAAEGLANEDLWFIQKTILGQNQEVLFRFNVAYLLFVVSLLSFLKDKNLLTPDGIKKIDDFISNRFSLPNGNSLCFKNNFRYFAWSIVSKELISAPNQMVKALGYLENQIFDLSMDRNYPSFSLSVPFGFERIVGVWLEAVLLFWPRNSFAKEFGEELKLLAETSLDHHICIRNDLLAMLNENHRDYEDDTFSLHRLFSLENNGNLEKRDFLNDELIDEAWNFISSSDEKLQNEVTDNPDPGQKTSSELKVPQLPTILLPKDPSRLRKSKIEICELQLEDGQKEFNERIARKIQKIVEEEEAKKVISTKSNEEDVEEYAKFFPCHGNYFDLLPTYRIDGGIPKCELELSHELKNYLPKITLFKDGAIQFLVTIQSDELIKPKEDGENTLGSPNPNCSSACATKLKIECYNWQLKTFVFLTPKQLGEGEGYRRVTLKIDYFLDADNYLIIRKIADNHKEE